MDVCIHNWGLIGNWYVLTKLQPRLPWWCHCTTGSGLWLVVNWINCPQKQYFSVEFEDHSIEPYLGTRVRGLSGVGTTQVEVRWRVFFTSSENQSILINECLQQLVNHPIPFTLSTDWILHCNVGACEHCSFHTFGIKVHTSSISASKKKKITKSPPKILGVG